MPTGNKLCFALFLGLRGMEPDILTESLVTVAPSVIECQESVQVTMMKLWGVAVRFSQNWTES